MILIDDGQTLRIDVEVELFHGFCVEILCVEWVSGHLCGGWGSRAFWRGIWTWRRVLRTILGTLGILGPWDPWDTWDPRGSYIIKFMKKKNKT